MHTKKECKPSEKDGFTLFYILERISICSIRMAKICESKLFCMESGKKQNTE